LQYSDLWKATVKLKPGHRVLKETHSMWNFDSLSHFNAFENKTSNATIQNV